MNRVFLTALVVVAACGNGRKDKCGAIRDRMLEDGPKLIAKALPEIDPARRDEMQKQGEHELDQMGALLLAAGVAGHVLPVDHPLWQQVRELYDLGAIASAAACTALVNGARVR